jgi:hypothetical protein
MPAGAGRSGIVALRVLLVADLLTRAGELGNLQVLTEVVSDDFPGPVSAVERAAGSLGIHPPAARAGRGDAPASPDSPADVHVVSSAASVENRLSGLVTCVGDARMRGTGDQGEATGDLLAGHERDPLAVRLALMSFPVHQLADLTDSVLAGAHDTVGDWRRRVARWAEQPSRPIPAHLAQTARDAFGNLDTLSAIALLRGLADDDGVPAGAKFETFLYVDRVLGLDLPRDIGKPG